MPIEGMEEVEQLQRLGHIRRGYQTQVTGQDGKPKTKPVATSYFIVPPEVEEHLKAEGWIKDGEKPTVLPIHFLLELDKALPHFLMQFAGSGKLRCSGDGAAVWFRKWMEKEGGKWNVQTLIFDRVARWDAITDRMTEVWKREYGTAERYGGEAGNTFVCLKEECPQFKKRSCKPTGFLKFGIEGLERQGYYQMVVHQSALRPLYSQLRWARDLIEQYLGRPTILHASYVMTMRGPEKMNIGGRPTDVWTPWVELEPTWLKKAKAGRVKLPCAPQIRITDIYNGDGIPGIQMEDALDMPPEVMEDLNYEPEEEDEIAVSPEEVPSPAGA